MEDFKKLFAKKFTSTPPISRKQVKRTTTNNDDDDDHLQDDIEDKNASFSEFSNKGGAAFSTSNTSESSSGSS
jgi:hypothetical protein